MAGIYIHIPFCKQACHYCDFHFSTSLRYKEDLLEALKKEIQLQSTYLETPVSTIYFGGGTPSLLEASSIEKLILEIEEHHSLTEDLEITLEANPDDISPDYLRSLRTIGVNRLSLGIQSFHNSELSYMNRAHTSDEAHKSIQSIQEAGFENYSVDLIFGVQCSTLASWQANIEKVLQYDVPHLACYNLTIEQNTVFGRWLKDKKIDDVPERLSKEQFELTMDILGRNGYEHYEISNYALPGYHSRHNSNYWNRVPYLGIGPAAHSYNGITRQWNISNNAKYISSIGDNHIPASIEHLTEQDRHNEYLMTGLRTAKGCQWKVLEKLTPGCKNVLLKEMQVFIEQGHLIKDNSGFKLSSTGKLIADQISASLFMTD